VNWYREKRAKEKNRRPNLIPMSTKHMVFFSGLRGAVAYACANIFPDQNGNRSLSASPLSLSHCLPPQGSDRVTLLDRIFIDSACCC
jgi:NhaP-type Na+/H+ or K+/H+ antiporter